MKAKAVILAIMLGVVLYIQFCLDIKSLLKASIQEQDSPPKSESMF